VTQALYGKRPSPYYGNNSSNKQREMTVRHYFNTLRSVNPENVKNFECFFNIKGYDETGSHEDCHRKRRPRVTSAAENKFIRDTNLRNYSPHKYRVQVTDTSHIHLNINCSDETA
jgi:hypothetical protein